MRPPKPGLPWLLASTVLFAGCLVEAQQQPPAVFNVESSRIQLSSLAGLWRFHTGDDPRWADPSFDDSSWRALHSDQGWSTQGYGKYAGFGWYRFSLQLPARSHGWSLLLPRVFNSYEVFADGRHVGAWGSLPPHQEMFLPIPRVLRLPPDPQGKNMLIAVRVWSYLEGAGAGPFGESWVGEPKAVERIAQDADAANRWSRVNRICLTLVFLLAGSAGLSLFLLRPSESEYLWFALYGFGNACEFALNLLSLAYPTLSIPALNVCGAVFFTIKDVAMILFAGRLLKATGDRVLWMAAVAAIAILGLYTVWFGRILVVQQPTSGLSFEIFMVAVALCDLCLYASVVYTIVRAIRRNTPDAHLLLYPLCLAYAANLFSLTLTLTYIHGWPWLVQHSQWFFSLISRPFPIAFDDIAEFLTQGALLGMLVLRFARTRRDEERLENELAAARVVQQVLIPEETPELPGFTVQSAYHPASQVGGDFFQIFPAASGGLIVVVGDVSGKGMPAAMTVALLVGAARTLAEGTDSPAVILGGLNRRAIGHSSGGFTTCLCCRITGDGTLTFANAGHLAPYLGGRELELATGLPLGLDVEAGYEETILHLPCNARLTFLSDGVVEAKSSAGELLGFQRACEMSSQPAEEIAQAAKDFGQEDDITVLTLTRHALAEAVTHRMV